MNKLKKVSVKSISFLMVAIMLLLPMTVFAKSYTSSIYFAGEHKGETRVYTGNNISIEMNAYTYYINTDYPSYAITLVRKKPWYMPDEHLSQKVFPRNGYKKDTWFSAGPGEYYFFFSKSRDGITVYSDTVLMYDENGSRDN